MTSQFELSVLGSFSVSIEGRRWPGLSRGSQRLLAFLALSDRIVSRVAVSGTLWPEASEMHAQASLRSELSRLNEVKRTLVRVTPRELSLVEDVAIDIREARAMAHRLLKAGAVQDGDLDSTAIVALSADLLPDWYEDWAVSEAEDWRQLRLHALDALAERLATTRRFADATSAALAAVKAEPLRETAHAILIRIYLAEGNRAEALSAFQRYKALLQTELGLAPTGTLLALVRDL